MLSQSVTNTSQLHIQQFTGLDNQTVQRLHSPLAVVRYYPFHGPVIVQIDQQRIGIRYTVFQTLIGGH